nr:hypothetical protein [Tanacetum cinerariifolium]
MVSKDEKEEPFILENDQCWEPLWRDSFLEDHATIEGYEMVSKDEKEEPFILENDQCWEPPWRDSFLEDHATIEGISLPLILARCLHRLRRLTGGETKTVRGFREFLEMSPQQTTKHQCGASTASSHENNVDKHHSRNVELPFSPLPPLTFFVVGSTENHSLLGGKTNMPYGVIAGKHDVPNMEDEEKSALLPQTLKHSIIRPP